ncbi:MAG: glutamate--cysteine ligase, partial [Haliea sp.]
MTPHLQKQLQTLAGPGYRELLQRIQRGLEKESLRITPEGRLAQTPHPAGLGSALTPPTHTTEYTEAQREINTPVDTT